MKRFDSRFCVIALAVVFSVLITTCANSAADDGLPPLQSTDDEEIAATELLGKVLILHAYGTGSPGDGGVTHSFIELYNKSNEDADLTGYSLQYSTGGTSWRILDLEGQTIPPKSSFLVLGRKNNEIGRLPLDEAEADMVWLDGSLPLRMDNKSWKILLVKSVSPVGVQNPFNIDGQGKKAEGYVDLLGTNANDGTGNIDGYETRAPFLISKGKSARRVSLIDTDDNSRDFELLEWRMDQSKALNGEEAEAMRPRWSGEGQWDPVYLGNTDKSGDAGIVSLTVASVSAGLGTPELVYSSAQPGSVSILNTVSENAMVTVRTAEGAAYRTAKATGTRAPVFDGEGERAYSFGSGDFLYIEVTAENGLTQLVYKVAVTVTQVSAVTVSGTVSLNLNSPYPQEKILIEAWKTQAAEDGDLVSRGEADLTTGKWSLRVPSGQTVWFKVTVTDTTGFTFGKVVSASGTLIGQNGETGISLTLGGYALPEISAFTLLNATASSGIKGNKAGTINQASGTISFANTSFTTLHPGTILDFHRLAADFTLSEGSKLYAGNVEQISGISTNNYYRDVTFTVAAGDNTRKTYTIAGQVLVPHDHASGAVSGADNTNTVNRVAGTSSWQTQGFGIMIIDTVDKTLGLPVGDPNPNTIILNNVWNPTGTFTYIGPTGRIIEGETEIKGRGNYSLRHNPNKSYNLKLNAPASFDYYDYETKQYIQLPAHRRWGLLAHQADVTRIKTTLGFEMGRRILTNMGWHPHGECVFFFLNGQYKGMYILTEIIKPEEGRHGITPLISTGNPNGGWMVEINNSYFYYNEGNNNYTFDDLYSFMTSHQNPVDNRQQGVVWSFKEPDSNMGWYYPDPPTGNGFLTFTNPDHAGYFPRKGILLMATLEDGTAYNRRSSPAANWIVPNDSGQTNGIGAPGLLRTGTIGQNNGGIYGDRTLGEVYPGYGASTFVKAAQFLQDAEDAVYSHDWLEKGYGKGSYLDYIDIDSFIDWQIGKEMCADWELAALNGHHAHFDPKKGKLVMGPMWDLDQQWQNTSVSRGCTPGFTGKTAFWLKEILGWEITANNGNSISPGQEKPAQRDRYYADRLQARWNVVKGQFPELYNYIDAQDARFKRIENFNNTNNGSSPASGSSTGGVPIPFLPTASSTTRRIDLKSPINTRINGLSPIIENY